MTRARYFIDSDQLVDDHIPLTPEQEAEIDQLAAQYQRESETRLRKYATYRRGARTQARTGSGSSDDD